MLPITFRALRDRRISLLVFALGSVLLLWMYVGMYPSIQAQSASFQEAFKNYPEGILKVLNVEQLDFSHVENFIAMEQFSIVWPMLVIFLLLAMSAGSIAGEAERGTAELLLSRPVSRGRIFWEKYFAGCLVLVGFSAVSSFAIIPFAALHDVPYVLSRFTTMFFLCVLFAWAIFSLGMVASAFASERSRAYGVAGGALVLMYVLTIVSALKENVENFKYLSFFSYFDSSAALNRGEISLASIIVFTTFALAATVIAAWRFQKRDVAV